MITMKPRYPVSLAQIEKKFGPCLAGIGMEDTTISAVEQVLTGKAKGTYIGVIGIVRNAAFHVHFPQVIDLSHFRVKRKGLAYPADSVRGLSIDGSQSHQGRRMLFDQWKKKFDWEKKLQSLQGEFQAELSIPELKLNFDVTIGFTGQKRRKAVIKGAMAPK